MALDPYADYDLEGRVAVITGAASGIGASSAEVLAAAGCKVVLGDVDHTGLSELGERIVADGGEAVVASCDVSRRADVEALIGTAVERFGRLDVMANIAGVMNSELVGDVTEEHLDRIIGINMRGAFYGCAAAISVMTPQGSGSIINFASTAIYFPAPRTALYSMTKAAVAMLTMDLAVEVGPQNIRVNCLAPGPTPTRFGRERLLDDKGEVDPAKVEDYSKRNTALSPLGRLGEPIDQAHLVHYLASDASKFVTGAVLRANGGVGISW
ncbi:MAG: glucose 1-dehydrogenase [Acidimicrobiales bacterium]